MTSNNKSPTRPTTNQLEDDDEPENDIEEEIRKLLLSLCNEDPHTIFHNLQQFKQIAAGTHKAIPIQAPEVNQNTKGQPALNKKIATTSTKQNPSAFEVVESDLKKQSTLKKRSSTTQRTKSKQMKCENLGSKVSDKNDYNNDHAEYAIEETNGEESKDDDGVDSKAGSDDEGKEEICVKKEIDTKQSGNNNYSQIPTYLHKYVKNLFDPLGNGNCGFRCIAKALGYKDDRCL
ncbi:hypothetical protein PCASD_16259 [Puccinia coronata f. sp. avenae]|uniref:OTU domain-containing protein n=1 Tax=Puccinia coronata f. sp. avenae TaxID=200324 RepID=A0A2N5TPU3_9BASI|nr:hypothetical protein PCASD_16259 [Puccinia coronata f. sp. avenae]